MTKLASETLPDSISPHPALTDRRERTRRTLDELKSERNQLLTEFAALSLCSNEQEESQPELEARLKGFCQILMDYLALGHFELYQRITEGQERRTKVREAATAVYPVLMQTTEILVEFNDHYAGETACRASKQLASDIYRLKETLSLHFEMEDSLLSAMRDEALQTVS